MEESTAIAAPVNTHAESPRAPDTSSPIPTGDMIEVETEKSPVTEQELHKTQEDSAESDKARTDSDEEEEEPVAQLLSTTETQEQSTILEEPQEQVEQPKTPVEQTTTPVEQPTTPVNQVTTPVDQPSTLVDQFATSVDQITTTQVEQPTTPVEQQPTARVEQPTTPVEKSTTPVEQPTTTPVQQPTTPVNEVTTPVELSTTLVEQLTAPVEQPATPIEERDDPPTEYSTNETFQEEAVEDEQSTAPLEQLSPQVEQPTTPVDQPTTPVEECDEPSTPVGEYHEDQTFQEEAEEDEQSTAPLEQLSPQVEQSTTPVDQPTTPVEECDEPSTPVGEYPAEQTFREDNAEEEEVVTVVHESVKEFSPSSPVADSPIEEKMQVQDYQVEVPTHEVELVIPSPKRPAPLNLVHHDIDDEASDSEEEESAAVAGENDDEDADLGTPLGYGGTADFGEGQDEFTSHRFLGPSVASDPSSVRGLHSIRRVALHEKPPRFASEAPVVAASSGSLTSSGESSGRNSSSASNATDAKSGLRSQSEVDYVERPLNTYALTFTEPVLGFNTNVVVSLENELLVEVWSVDKDGPAQRSGVVVGDYLISVNGQTIEPHMTKEQVFEIIQTSTIPRTLVFQRDVHDKDAQSKSLPDKKHALAKPLIGRLGAAMSQGALIIGSKWKRKKTIVHQNSFCDGCGMDPIVGALWTCSVCSNYNLCNECYDLGTHGMENTEQMQALSEAIVQYKLLKRCKHFTPEFLLSLRRDICKGRPDKFEYLGEWIANIVVGTSAAKITVRGIEIPSLPPTARQRFVSYLMPLVSNRTDIEVNIEWVPDEAEPANAVCRASVDRMSVGMYNSDDEDGAEGGQDNLEKLRIWISDKKTRTTSPFA